MLRRSCAFKVRCGRWWPQSHTRPLSAEIRGLFDLTADRTDYADRSIQFSPITDYIWRKHTFNTKIDTSSSWSCLLPSRRSRQIYCIALVHGWRGPVVNCRSFWSTHMHNVCDLVRDHICLRLVCGCTNAKPAVLCSCIDIYLDRKLSDFGYTDDTTLFNEDRNLSQVFLGRLNDSVGMFTMHFTSAKCQRNRTMFKQRENQVT